MNPNISVEYIDKIKIACKRLTTTPLYTKQALSKKAEGLRFIRHP